MNKQILLALLLLTTAVLAVDYGVGTTTASDKVWVVDKLYHTSYPTTYPAQIQPNDQGVWLDVEMVNFHTVNYYDISSRLEITGPFEGLVTEAEIANAKPNERVHAFYQLNILDNAKPGEYKLRHYLTYYYDEYDNDGDKTVVKVEAIKTLSVNVYYSERIEIKEILVEPYNVLPGEDVELQILLANTGSVTVNDVDVNYSIATDATEINLLPITTTSRRVASIKPGEEITVSFPMQALKTSVVKPYKIEVDAQYTSGSTTNTESDEVAVEIRGEPEMRLAGVQVDKEVIYQGSPFSISIQLENVGTGDAKSVKTVLLDGGMEGVMTSYVGTVEVDDTGSAIFDVRDSEAGSKKITALITFEDAYGNDFTESVEVEYFITTVTADYTGFIALFVLVVVIGGWYWRKQQKKKKIQSLVK